LAQNDELLVEKKKNEDKEENPMSYLKKLNYLIVKDYKMDTMTLKMMLACLNSTKIETLKYNDIN